MESNGVGMTDNGESASNKLFIGGVSWETSDDDFRNYFGEFGEMSDCVLMRDRNTGRSRGFGFVTYVDPNVTERVLAQDLELSGRKLDAKVAVPKDKSEGGDMGRSKGPSRDIKKIFVGALAQGTTQEEFDDYFKQYGEVTDSIIMIDKGTGRSRGFGFVTYADSSSVDRVLQHNSHEIHGKRVDCKKATPRDQMRAPPSGGRGPPYTTSSPYQSWGGNDYDRPPQWADQRGGSGGGGGWSGGGNWGGNGGGWDRSDRWGSQERWGDRWSGERWGGNKRWASSGPTDNGGGNGAGYGPRWGSGPPSYSQQPSGPPDHPYYKNRYRPY